MMLLNNSTIPVVQLHCGAAGDEKVFLRDAADLCFTSQMGHQALLQGRTGC